MEENKNIEFEDQKIVPINMEGQVKGAFLAYAMSVLTSRALPDVRDGMKPGQRRILYAMYEDNLTSSNAFRKSATTVGNVLGRYHPHGDAAVYGTMVRMAQKFSYRYPLIQGQGNFGSIDGDPPAAYRYTESRMAKISDELMQKAAAIVMISFFTLFVSALLLLAFEPVSMMDGLFEAISAVATVGLSRGLTVSLGTAGRLVIIATMYLGRIGPISMALFLARPKPGRNSVTYGEGKFYVG